VVGSLGTLAGNPAGNPAGTPAGNPGPVCTPGWVHRVGCSRQMREGGSQMAVPAHKLPDLPGCSHPVEVGTLAVADMPLPQGKVAGSLPGTEAD